MESTMPVFAIANQKGGAGKTTTAAAVGVLLSRQGQRVHLVDTDPQASLTSTFGARDSEGLLYQAMSDRTALPVVEVAENLTLTPSSIDLARGESEFMGELGREFILKTCLERTELAGDVLVVLDCPPSLGVLAVNCLTAAEKLVVAVQPGGYELQALVYLQETVGLLKERINPRLEIVGAVLANCKMRRVITEDVRREVGRLYPVLGLVRGDAKLLYATTAGTLLKLHKSNALDDYAGVVGKLQEMRVWPEKQLAA